MKTVGVYIWPNMTALDVLGPQQILGFVPDFDVITVAKSMDPVVTDTKIRILPDHDFASCPPLDIVLVGGGVDPSAEMRDEAVLSWLRQQGGGAEYVTSVCTGALILAEAGLLDGYKATTHWAHKEHLAGYPKVELAEGRVVTDRNRITGGGVTAGIDFGFSLVAETAGPEVAAALQLLGEYAPQPPTPFGNPDAAPPELVAAVRAQTAELSPGLTEFFAAKN
ncbi:MAG: cyclohexyl-isocyanide hydratase [Gaiellales bacterium]|nr:cyclohexyl-isocyanide hydratase [Gaiellales bacterium]